MSEEQRAYRRDLALYCLTREPAPVTAADLAIGMQAAAQTEGHPRALWGWLDGVSTLGVLRTLHKAGQAELTGLRRDSALGRDVPQWIASSGARTPMPAPPSAAQDVQDALAVQQAADRLGAAARLATPATEELTVALRALSQVSVAEFIALFAAATQAPPVAKDE